MRLGKPDGKRQSAVTTIANRGENVQRGNETNTTQLSVLPGEGGITEGVGKQRRLPLEM
jgi:hypothetical protein